MCNVPFFSGRQMIGYVRAWQNVLNAVAAKNGNKAFQFNTYTISVLVIFFLQMNYKLPTAADAAILASSIKGPGTVSYDDKKNFGNMLLDFFHFYGSRYEINNHLISARIGRWQEQRLTGQQKHFTPEQKRFVFCFKFFSSLLSITVYLFLYKFCHF